MNKIECECGKYISKKNLLNHKKSNLHIENFNNKERLNFINNRISKEICYDTIHKLNNINYKECPSVIKKVKILKDILEKHKIENIKIDLIINDYLSELIPPGTKGVFRGNEFNKIVKNTIENMKLEQNRFEICFEKKM